MEDEKKQEQEEKIEKIVHTDIGDYIYELVDGEWQFKDVENLWF